MKAGETPPNLRLVEARGPGGFQTRRLYRQPDGSLRLWLSRHHRKRLQPSESERLGEVLLRLGRAAWMPGDLNWWIGSVFSIGAALFGLGSLLVLLPGLARLPGLEGLDANAVFFAGSIPFTTAAYLQLWQAANAGEFTEQGRIELPKRAWFGWRPHDLGWQSCAFQFIGTILFNFNTFDAMLPGLGWIREDLFIWVPNFVGSVLFLISGYQAFLETCHRFWAWRPRSLPWWIVIWNLFGCLAFMASACLAWYLPIELPIPLGNLATLFTLLGAIGFLGGSQLMLLEAAGPPEPPAQPSG